MPRIPTRVEGSRNSEPRAVEPEPGTPQHRRDRQGGGVGENDLTSPSCGHALGDETDAAVAEEIAQLRANDGITTPSDVSADEGFAVGVEDPGEIDPPVDPEHRLG